MGMRIKTQARPVFKGDIVHIQRRTLNGYFFLVPKPETVRLIQYAYALAAERYGLVLHALCIMSTHVHVIASDPRGLHPEFTAYAHRTIALGLKKMHAIEGPIWHVGGVPVQRLVGRDAAVEALAYVRANPVAAGCVSAPSEYTGVFGVAEPEPLEVYSRRLSRPACFGPRSELPDEAVFRTSAPKLLLDELGEEGAERALKETIARHVAAACEERAAKNLGFLGMKRVLSADIWRRAPSLGRSKYRPTYKGVVAEAIRQARATLALFREAYARAMMTFRHSDKYVLFPVGTYLMCRRYGCLTEEGIEGEIDEAEKLQAGARRCDTEPAVLTF